MNIDAVSQLSDVFSFIFVTPEFLSEHTLETIKAGLRKTANKIAVHYTKWPNKFSDGVIAMSLITQGVISASIFWLVTRYLLPHDYKWIGNLVTSAFFGYILFGFLIIMLHLVSLIIFRRFLFVVGALLFLATRATLFWHYFHSGLT